MREGPYWFGIPDPDCAGMIAAVAWKQDNNGETFIALESDVAIATLIDSECAERWPPRRNA